jgi:hypothetical protein
MLISLHNVNRAAISGTPRRFGAATSTPTASAPSATKEGIPLARHERGWDVEDIEEVDRLAEEEEEED